MNKVKKYILKTLFPVLAAGTASVGTFLALRTKNRLKESVPHAGYSHSHITKRISEYITPTEPLLFQSGTLKTICGALIYDISKLEFPEKSVLTCDVHMGAITVIVPEHINVILDGVSFVGNCASLTARYLDSQVPQLYVKARAYMGSVCIKSSQQTER